MNFKKTIQLSLILVALISLACCASRQIVPGEPSQDAPGAKLFKKAGKRFDAGRYEDAFTLYHDYLNIYPESPLAPMALIKIGAIYSVREDYEAARQTYQEIVTKYPDSPFVHDARLEILITHYHEGEFLSVINGADSIDDHKAPYNVLIRKYAVIGDAYMALGFFPEAADAFLQVYAASQDQERDKAIDKLGKAVTMLSPQEMESILAQTTDPALRAYLMHRLGMKYAMEEDYENALAWLTEFVAEFPDDNRTPDVLDLIEEYKEKAVYERYTIGCLLPLSGRYEVFGVRALKGIELALSQLTALGHDFPIQLIIKDTEANPAIAVQAVNELADRKAAAIIGPIVTADAAAEAAQARHIPIITLTQKDNIVETGNYVFRNFLTPQMQVKTILNYAVEELGLTRFAILYPDEKYGITFMNLFWDEVIALGGEVVGVESYTSSQSDFSVAIKKLVGLYYDVPIDLLELEDFIFEDEVPDEPEAIVDFDAIFIPDGPEKSGLILPALTYHDVTDTYLLGTNLWHSNRLIDMAKHHARGAIMPEIFFAESADDTVKEFVRLFEETFAEKPGFIEAISYDTATILFDVISRPHIRFRSSIRNELMSIHNFPGATGLTRFSENGDAEKRLFLLQITRRGFVELDHD
jgi:branched-chain amino acid transport system substrate-binding protein